METLLCEWIKWFMTSDYEIKLMMMWSGFSSAVLMCHSCRDCQTGVETIWSSRTKLTREKLYHLWDKQAVHRWNYFKLTRQTETWTGTCDLQRLTPAATGAIKKSCLAARSSGALGCIQIPILPSQIISVVWEHIDWRQKTNNTT